LKKVHLYYGWYVVLASMVIATYFSAIFSYGWTSFVTPILASFGWSMTQLSLASTLRGVEVGVFNPLWGVAVDRWPLRILMIFGIICSALGIFIISRCNNLWIFYTGFLVLGIASSATTSMIPNTAISRWFQKDVGKANGLFYTGMGLGGMLVPLVTYLIDHIGWRETLLYGSIGMLVVGLPLSLVFRKSPDENRSPSQVSTIITPLTPTAAIDNDMSLKQASKTRAFWYFNLVILLQGFVLSIMSLYCMPYMEGLGISRTTASFIISLFTFISVGVRMPMGMLSDVFQKKYVIALTMVLITIAMVVFWFFSQHTPFWVMVIFAAFYGMGVSGVLPLRMPLMADYFGRRNMGKLFGAIGISSSIGIVVSVPVAGWVYDSIHSYKPVIIGLAAFSLLSVILILAMPNVKRRGIQTLKNVEGK
jgi:MFS family permease